MVQALFPFLLSQPTNLLTGVYSRAGCAAAATWTGVVFARHASSAAYWPDRLSEKADREPRAPSPVAKLCTL